MRSLPQSFEKSKRGSSLKEKAIENQILSWLKINKIFAFKVERTGIYDAKIGCFRRKNSVHHIRGVSDILGIYKKRMLAIEVKAAKGSLSRFQTMFLQDVNNNGGVAIVARSIEDVELALQKLGENHE